MQQRSIAVLPRRAMAAVAALATALAIVLVPTAAYATDYSGQLNPGQTLYPNDSLWSPSGEYRLHQQGDGNLVMMQMPGGKPLWSNGQAGKPGTETRMQGDGNVVSVHNGVPVWTTHTQNNWNSTLHMQNDANIVVRKPGNIPIWSTGSQSIGNCSDGDRGRSQHYANTGQWRNPFTPVTWTETVYFDWWPYQKTFNLKLELRYNDADRCVYGLLTGGDVGMPVYLDVSTTAGIGNWSGWQHSATVASGNTSAYTGVQRDGRGYWVRACTHTQTSGYKCTDWY